MRKEGKIAISFVAAVGVVVGLQVYNQPSAEMKQRAAAQEREQVQQNLARQLALDKYTEEAMKEIDALVESARTNQPSVDCDPNYVPQFSGGACVPDVPYDLDCPDIEDPVIVIGIDVHRFDRDQNGLGCEWN